MRNLGNKSTPICRDNRGLESQQLNGGPSVTPKLCWMIVHLCLRKSRRKTNSRLKGPGPQSAVALGKNNNLNGMSDKPGETVSIGEN